jgi:hypothetical protein
VLVGLDYGNPSKRVEAGEVVSDIPAKSVQWLLDQNLIEVVDAPSAKKSGRKTDEVEGE